MRKRTSDIEIPGRIYFCQVSSVAEPPTLDSTKILAAPELAGLRVLLVHEWLYTWAGAERCLDQLRVLMPHADVVAGVVTDDMRQSHQTASIARQTWVGSLPGAHSHHRWFVPLHAMAFAAIDTASYDVVLSVSHSFAKAAKAAKARNPGAIHLCYCLTPPRYLYDLRRAHGKLAGPVQRVALRIGGPVLRAVDRTAARGVDHFVTLAAHVADRIKRHYGRESAVVYPPVMVSRTHRREPREEFLLSLGRLVPYKRVELAIEAAERIGMPLIVAGEGPERARLERLAGPRTEFLGAVSEDEAARLMASCRAFVFCAEEDFGIAPVEANGYGTPVVAFGRGGVCETMVPGETAVLFQEQTVESLTAAIRECLSRTWDDEALRANADRFSSGNFHRGMRREIAYALQKGGR
jgi:glycosyltransferase involved in cell wall biosynthesis